MPNTYEDHESQPGHRPGMESVVNRGADARDSSGSRVGARRMPGEADEATRHQMLAGAEKSEPAPKGTAPTPSPADTDASGVGGRQREQTVMDQVQNAGG